MEHGEVVISWIQVFIAVVSFICAGVVAIIRVGYLLGQFEKSLEEKIKNVSDNLKIDYSQKIESTATDGEKKVARVYERFDEHKRFCDGMFVRVDMCAVVHKNSAEAFMSINKRLDGFSEKIDELKDLILGKKTI